MLKRSFLAVLTAVFVAGTVQASALACPPPSAETRAADLRKLQTRLMVAALSCRETPMPSKYNAFVQKFGGNLQENARVLKAAHGKRFDSYITSLANDASIRLLHQPEGCGGEETVADAALAAEPQQIEGFAVAKFTGEPTCTANPGAEKPKGKAKAKSKHKAKDPKPTTTADAGAAAR